MNPHEPVPTGTPRQDEVLGQYTKRLIEAKVRRLARRRHLRPEDLDDISQQLWSAIISRCGQYAPERGAVATFVDRVVSSTVKNILRDSGRRKRQATLPILSIDPSTTISTDDRLRHLDTSHAPFDEMMELKEALEQVLRGLPDDIRSFAELLKSRCAAAAARQLGMSRHKREAAIRILRERFASAGLASIEQSGQGSSSTVSGQKSVGNR